MFLFVRKLDSDLPSRRRTAIVSVHLKERGLEGQAELHGLLERDFEVGRR